MKYRLTGIISTAKQTILPAASLALLALVITCFLSCGKARVGEIPTPSQNLHNAINLYDNEDYLKAEQEFSTITLNYPGSVVVDSAEFYLGLTHFALKEYILAASSFQRVVMQYPRSPLVPESQFRIGECYYLMSPFYALDQEYTLKAVEELQKYLEDYPDHQQRQQAEQYLLKCREKLAKKEYSSGVLYLKIEAYNSAIVYFDEVLNNYYDTKYAPLALYNKGEALRKDNQPAQAIEIFTLFLTKYPNHYYKARAQERLNGLTKPDTDQETSDG
jgi:outer membrane protein assembly factor BamD